jgi:hypothetical protein
MEPYSGTPAEPGEFSESEKPSSTGKRQSRRPTNSRRIQDLADPLKWIGLGLLGIYLATVVAAALPIKLLDPVWINQVCGSIRGGVSFPLEAMALIMIGAYLQRTSKEPPLVTDLRRLCSLVALGFVLMIPLQTWAGLQLIDRATENQQARIQPSDNALKAVYAATNGEQLLEAIRRIPGAPPNIGGRFEEPVSKVRERLIRELEPQVLQQKQQLNQVIAQIRRDSRISLVRDAIVALFSALAFAAIGRTKAHKPTLLQRLVGPSLHSSFSYEEIERLAEEFDET